MHIKWRMKNMELLLRTARKITSSSSMHESVSTRNLKKRFNVVYDEIIGSDFGPEKGEA